MTTNFTTDDNNTIVIINHSILPIPADPKTKCGYFPNFGSENRRKGGKWFKVQNDVWPAVFTKGETMTLAEFKHRYKGMLASVGFKNSYCKEMANIYHINNGPVHSGAITIK
jgi:hypothetical protein